MVQHSRTTIVIFFSMDRAMQLDMAIRSCRLYCKDLSCVKKVVIFKTTSKLDAEQYRQLQVENPDFQFVEERCVVEQIMELSSAFEFLSLHCDDNLYIRDFSFEEGTEILLENNTVLGHAFRLGKNITWNYPKGSKVLQPPFSNIDTNTLIWNWFRLKPSGFGYPLEVSGSIYRGAQILPLIGRHLDSVVGRIESHLMSYRNSFVQCPLFTCKQLPSVINVPVNRVGINKNLSGQKHSYSVKDLSAMFSKNLRINITPYANLISNACHEELEFSFVKRGDNERME